MYLMVIWGMFMMAVCGRIFLRYNNQPFLADDNTYAFMNN